MADNMAITSALVDEGQYCVVAEYSISEYSSLSSAGDTQPMPSFRMCKPKSFIEPSVKKLYVLVCLLNNLVATGSKENIMLLSEKNCCKLVRAR